MKKRDTKAPPGNGRTRKAKPDTVSPEVSNGEAPANPVETPVRAQAPDQNNAPPPVLDPFDPATYKVSQDLSAVANVKKHIVSIPVRKPDKTWWVRRHPGAEYSFTAWVVELREEQEVFLVSPEVRPFLVGEATFKLMDFHLAVNMQGKVFLWAVRAPTDDQKEMPSWMRAPLKAAALAKDQWTRITWNEQTREHDVNSVPNPTEPVFPSLAMKEVLQLAFKDYIIGDLNHPTLKKLRGEIA
jgi:hypothetical protein